VVAVEEVVIVLSVVVVVAVVVVVIMVVAVVVCPLTLWGVELVEVEVDVEIVVGVATEIVVNVVCGVVDSSVVLVDVGGSEVDSEVGFEVSSNAGLELDADVDTDMVVRGVGSVVVVVLEDVVDRLLLVVIVVTVGSQTSSTPSLTRHWPDSHFSLNFGLEPFPDPHKYTDPGSSSQTFGKVDPQALDTSRQVQSSTSKGSTIQRSASAGKFLRHPNPQLSALIGRLPLLVQL
jgi:hypothetical protein